MKTIPVNWVFLVQNVFSTDQQVLAGEFPSCFKGKQTRFSYVLARINQNEPLMTWLNLFLDDFNQNSR